MNDTKSPQAGSGKAEITLLDILKLLLSKSYWLLLAGVLAGACVFLVTTFLITPTYESRVSFYVYNSSNNSVQSGTINNGDLQAAESLATTYSKILASNSILDAVLQELGPDVSLSRKSLSGMVSVCEGKQKYLTPLYIGSALVNVALNFLLIPCWGATDAAVASLLTQISTPFVFPLLLRPLRPNGLLMCQAVLLRDVFPKRKKTDNSQRKAC